MEVIDSVCVCVRPCRRERRDKCVCVFSVCMNINRTNVSQSSCICVRELCACWVCTRAFVICAHLCVTCACI